jgi:hypothetical protein
MGIETLAASEAKDHNDKVLAEIIARLDRIERALVAYFASTTISQALAHDYSVNVVGRG